MRPILALVFVLLTGAPVQAGLGLLGVSAAGNQVAREAVSELKAGDELSASRLARSVASTEGAANLAVSVATGAVVELVPGGRLVRAGAGLALGAGVAGARGRSYSLGRAAAGTAGALAVGALFAPIPGGALVGGILGGIAGEELYGAVRTQLAPRRAGGS